MRKTFTLYVNFDSLYFDFLYWSAEKSICFSVEEEADEEIEEEAPKDETEI